jgi:regulator of sigma E protease
MLADPGPITTALLILLVIMIFNVIITVHELGHFLAAKWRGMRIDRFQIWFGKPIWKKTINGVQYGLGWIPAGGFVALPQMAPMDAIEGENLGAEPPPPISPLDKIIVAFAGPLFSFLLALTAALVLTAIKKPVDIVPTTTVGWVQADSPADEAGFRRGDRILAINGNPVDTWNLPLDSVFMEVVTSRGNSIRFTVDRPGEGKIELHSDFEIPQTKWWQRKKTREVGLIPMSPEGDITVTDLTDDPNAPARLGGLKPGDVILAVDGEEIVQREQLFELIRLSKGRTLEFTVLRDGEETQLEITPARPASSDSTAKDKPLDYMIGATFQAPQPVVREWRRPGPFKQVGDTLRTMWITLTTVASPDSDIGIQHLSGPVGIGKIQYFSLLLDNPFHRILTFMVLINVNLALLNLLPFPVLDGGHITIATMEAIARRPVNVRFLEVLQLAFVFLLFGIMLYVTSKDVVDDFGMGSRDEPAPIVFPKPDSVRGESDAPE